MGVHTIMAPVSAHARLVNYAVKVPINNKFIIKCHMQDIKVVNYVAELD